VNAERTIVDGRFGIDPILSALARLPGGDPTSRRVGDRWWRASRGPDGPVTLAFYPGPDRVVVDGWGPGAPAALSRVRSLLGADDDPSGFAPHHPPLAEALARSPELRFGRAGEVVDFLVPTVLGQRVTGREAARSYRSLVARYGDPAPGPLPDLHLPPDPGRLAQEPYYALHPHGIERTRATTLLNVCQRRGRLDSLAARPASEARQLLRGLPGIGPWTTETVLAASHGDPDAVPTGDFHLPSMVAWVLAGEPRADDARMLELLAPYAGHRGRALRLLYSVGRGAPKFGPRVEVPDLRRM
jgi:3-methyladenine DNA glycosylase/8-oxoguanine DNA glycosylase